MMQIVTNLPLAFIVALRFVSRRKQGIQKVNPSAWSNILDDLYRNLPEGQNWFQQMLIDEMKAWILKEQLNTIKLVDAGVTHIGQLPK